jgi:hypothetical protein
MSDPKVLSRDAVFNYPTFAEDYNVAVLDVTNKMHTLSRFRGSCRCCHRLPTQTDDVAPSGQCRFVFSVSSRGPLNCGDASCLRRCHRAFVSNSCHFSGPIRKPPDGPAEVLGQRPGAFAQFRHVTAGTKQSPGRITPTAIDGNFWSAQREEPPASMKDSGALAIWRLRGYWGVSIRGTSCVVPQIISPAPVIHASREMQL